MNELTGFEIAIVGMACQFPDANSKDEFWQNIIQGHESIRPLSESEMLAAGISLDQAEHPDYVNSGSFLEGIDQFDASLFGYSAKEADIMDPQHRLFLQIAWQALEQSGYCNDDTRLRIGVYAGSSGSSYLNQALSHPGQLKYEVSPSDLAYENNQDLLATRVAYKLNLRGPAVTMATACSTSLVLVHHGCQALIAGECDVALVGAARASVPQKSGYTYSQGGILSKDGKCRPFDKQASGTISGSGVGAVVLRRLEDAIASRDNIMAIIKGTAINNDGTRKIGFTAPSVAGQTEVIKNALYAADVSADSIGYVEAHGTATALGDPIEFKALTNAYSSFTEKRNYCAMGSVKANIGHLDSVAGIAGIAKAVAVLQHKKIPPLVHYKEPNPEINLDDSPFYMSDTVQPWKDGLPLRAAVSAFGIGGTNAHLILEAFEQQRTATPGRDCQLLTFSGSSEKALNANLAQFAEWLELQPEDDLPDIAYSQNTGRKRLAYHASFVCESREQALKILKKSNSSSVAKFHCREQKAPLVFLFPGQGSQYVGMGRGLYQKEAVFTEVLNQCADQLVPLLDGVDIRNLLYPDLESGQTIDASSAEQTRSDLYKTRFTQPCIFAFEYALARQLESWGIKAQAYLGHSVGEYVAACLSGVFSLEDALFLIAERARLMELQPTGAMLSVNLGETVLLPYLEQFDLSLAAVNAPESCVLSGTEDNIERLEHALKDQDCTPRRLHTSHAFHSHLMDGCLNEFRQSFSKIQLKQPAVPFISNLTGDWCDASQVTTVDYWVEHLRSPVLFASGVSRVLEHYQTFVEVGPGKVLSSLAMLQFTDQVSYSTVRDTNTPVADTHFLMETIGRLWCRGVMIDWKNFYASETRFRVPTPTYAFQTRRHWIFKENAAPENMSAMRSMEELQQKRSMDEWFYQPVWKQKALPDHTSQNLEDGYILCFVPRRNYLLPAFNSQVVWVRHGRQFKKVNQYNYRINGDDPADYQRLLIELTSLYGNPKRVVHAWNLSKAEPSMTLAYRNSFHSLLYLARALSDYPSTDKLQLLILSNCMQLIGKENHHHLVKSLLTGPCKVIPKEFEQINCKSVDLDPDFDFSSSLMQKLIHCELFDNEPFVAIRGGARYVNSVEPVHLAECPSSPSLTDEHPSPTYLITGGFGGIGATLAKHLSAQHRANIILTTRQALPPENTWEQWLSSHTDDNATSRKIKLLQQLKLQGSQCSVLVTDLNGRAGFRKALKKVEKICGAVNGVIHSAGAVDGALIQARSASESESVLHPKVAGTALLYEVFRQRPLRFFINCSSLSAHLGPIGQVAYCSANNYQDLFTQRPSAWQKTISVQWDSWKEVGMAVDTLSKTHGEDLKGIMHGITPSEGAMVLERLLHNNYSNIMISTRHFDVLGLSKDDGDPENAEREAIDDIDDNFHDRPDLSVEYEPAEDDLEQSIIDIWQDKFGIRPIGRHDNFFELHGHSLLAVQIITTIKQHHKTTLPAGTIYDNPTVACMAERVRELSSSVLEN